MQHSGCMMNVASVVAVLPGAKSSCALGEVRVVHSLLSADASGRIVHEHALQKI